MKAYAVEQVKSEKKEENNNNNNSTINWSGFVELWCGEWNFPCFVTLAYVNEMHVLNMEKHDLVAKKENKHIKY